MIALILIACTVAGLGIGRAVFGIEII